MTNSNRVGTGMVCVIMVVAAALLYVVLRYAPQIDAWGR